LLLLDLQPTPYRFLRIETTGPTSSGNLWIPFSELLLGGDYIPGNLGF